MAKGYLIGQIGVHDARAYQEYAQKVPASLVRYEGEFLVRGGGTETLEGDAPLQRIVVLEFPSLSRARDWYESEGYQALIPVRQAAAVTHSFLVEGDD